MYKVYILRSDTTGRFYIGYTSDLEDRLRRHNNGLTQTTRRQKGPWKLIYSECFEWKGDAIRREKEIKSWKSRERISDLVRGRSSIG